ncbi:hypothetical protein [Hyunsoonleella rubra]|uniref:Uncharacterized protein n=1 Tax=Hyunsoonleella rubra TaxID=1737062 RepID=A0ABW5T783_9FLAO
MIAKTLCIQKEEQKGCNGKCQLHKELKENNADKSSDNPLQNPERRSLDVFVVVSLPQNQQEHIALDDTWENQVDFRQQVPVHPFYDIDTPPPNLS